MISVKNILQSCNLRSTPIRRAVLELYLSEQRALSQRDIEESVSKDYNRITIYRTLKLFKKLGILHEVIDDKFTVKYAFCPMDQLPEDHAHFKCIECSQTYCLNTIVPFKNIQTDHNFEIVSQKTLYFGRCFDCKKEK